MQASEVEQLKAYLGTKAQASAPTTPPIDWEARRAAWLTNIAALYATIRGWIADTPGVIIDDSQTLTLNEEPVGYYEVSKLLLSVGGNRIEFRPAGMRIIGSQGRVDVMGPRGKTMLVLLSKGVPPPAGVRVVLPGESTLVTEDRERSNGVEWNFARLEGPGWRYDPLTPATLLAVMKQLLGN